jgi:predicted ferric reductase
MIRVNIINSEHIIKKLEKCITLSIFINHPEVSKLEWHPFTLTLGINKYESSFNIKNTGKWTKSFIEKVLVDSNHNIHQYINIGHITHSCFQFYKFYNNRIFFCSGIGITPFLTVIDNILNSTDNNTDNSNNILIWSIGDSKLIREFESIINNISSEPNLQIYVFYSNSSKQLNSEITRSQMNKFNFLQTLIHYHTDIDIIHSIKFSIITILQRINPINIISHAINNSDSDTSIGIFVCGGKSYSKSISNSVSGLNQNAKNIKLDLLIENV